MFQLLPAALNPCPSVLHKHYRTLQLGVAEQVALAIAISLVTVAPVTRAWREKTIALVFFHVLPAAQVVTKAGSRGRLGSTG